MDTKKVLVVEDNGVTQRWIAGILQSAGYTVLTAKDAATALNIARTEKPDLITMDIDLSTGSPGDHWDGFTIARWLRRLNQEGPRVPIVVLSNFDPVQVQSQIGEIGAYAFLHKPVEKVQLLAVVADAIKGNAGPAPAAEPPKS